MAGHAQLACEGDERRQRLKAEMALQGIDYVEVDASQCVIEVHFIGKNGTARKQALDAAVGALDGNVAAVAVAGGVRVEGIKVLAVQAVPPGDPLKPGTAFLRVAVDQPGDFSAYTLRLAMPNLDPAFAQVEFSFKAGCPSRFDCAPGTPCPPAARDEPDIDYMAKDYASFRQALLDLAATRGLAERHEADLGVALAELLAYAGDQVSYLQDAVANEAFLGTARHRVSVRRHARLIDYAMHDGASARVFVHVVVKAGGGARKLPAGTTVLPLVTVPLRHRPAPVEPATLQAALDPLLREAACEASEAVFETLADADLHERLNALPIHTWLDTGCCLPEGATSVDLEGSLTGLLKRGDYLLLEEVAGVASGRPGEADRRHRQVVRLTRVESLAADPLDSGTPLTRVTWGVPDALRFPLCVSARDDEGRLLPGLAVARGNLALADHGRTIEAETHPGREAPGPGLERALRVRLREGPLSFRIEPPGDDPEDEAGGPLPAADLAAQGPDQALPQVNVKTRVAHPDGSIDLQGTDWTPAAHLLDQEAWDTTFAVETDNDGRAVLRFGDGEHGRRPDHATAPDQALVVATYRVGCGARGNVGAEALAHVVGDGALAWVDDVRNPLPAWGGIDPEPIERVRQVAPAAMHARTLRAVTEADYAAKAEECPDVAQAVATFRWTGSWTTVFITAKPVGGDTLGPKLARRVRAWVGRFAQAGYDLEVQEPIHVPVELEVEVCVDPEHFRGDVERAVAAALGSADRPDGTRGLFHPDNFPFGQALYLSQVYAAVRKVEGVGSAEVTVLNPVGRSPAGEIGQGYLPIGRLEVVQLRNDPNFPERGVLRLVMRGGK
ncbi:MAG TPA: putative baseplate assembly protein [Candidatus Thermoplasmatota archaeon]|nr:putative baseplate assembly protein [Candidatus Thermoplasmatota archaeon]